MGMLEVEIALCFGNCDTNKIRGNFEETPAREKLTKILPKRLTWFLVQFQEHNKQCPSQLVFIEMLRSKSLPVLITAIPEKLEGTFEEFFRKRLKNVRETLQNLSELIHHSVSDRTAQGT